MYTSHHLSEDQLSSYCIKERLNEIDVLLDNGSIPIPGWQELHADRDVLNEFLWAYDDFGIDKEDNILFTNEHFARFVDVSSAVGTLNIEGVKFYVIVDK